MIQTEREHLERDQKTMALVNKDKALYSQRMAARRREARIDKIDKEMAQLKDELCEIKDLLRQIVNRN